MHRALKRPGGTPIDMPPQPGWLGLTETTSYAEAFVPASICGAPDCPAVEVAGSADGAAIAPPCASAYGAPSIAQAIKRTAVSGGTIRLTVVSTVPFSLVVAGSG